MDGESLPFSLGEYHADSGRRYHLLFSFVSAIGNRRTKTPPHGRYELSSLFLLSFGLSLVAVCCYFECNFDVPSVLLLKAA